MLFLVVAFCPEAVWSQNLTQTVDCWLLQALFFGNLFKLFVTEWGTRLIKAVEHWKLPALRLGIFCDLSVSTMLLMMNIKVKHGKFHAFSGYLCYLSVNGNVLMTDRKDWVLKISTIVSGYFFKTSVDRDFKEKARKKSIRTSFVFCTRLQFFVNSMFLELQKSCWAEKLSCVVKEYFLKFSAKRIHKWMIGKFHFLYKFYRFKNCNQFHLSHSPRLCQTCLDLRIPWRELKFYSKITPIHYF